MCYIQLCIQMGVVGRFCQFRAKTRGVYVCSVALCWLIDWLFSLCYFFFQAEDGIRDDLVTGVQTCALPISHGVEQQGFVCDRPLGPEASLIREVGLNRHRTHLRSWSLRVECDRDSLVRLNANRDDVGSNGGRNAGEQCLWRWFEVHADLRQISCKTLPTPDVERNSRPTPVLNLKSHRCVGLGCRAGIHAWLLPIARYRFPVNHAGTILPSSGESCYILDTHRSNGSKYLHL